MCVVNSIWICGRSAAGFAQLSAQEYTYSYRLVSFVVSFVAAFSLSTHFFSNIVSNGSRDACLATTVVLPCNWVRVRGGGGRD